MATSIYYFSGTGNSLHVARTIAEQLGDSKVINIAWLKPDVIEDKNDTVGIVFPVFYLDAPNIVKDFVKKLRLDPNAYVFSIATCGGQSGNSFQTLDKILKVKGGHLSAGFTLKTVDNAYIGMNLVTPLENREKILKASDEELTKIIEILNKREKHKLKLNYNIVSGIEGGMSSTFATHLYGLPRRFNVTDKCTGCGICQKLCPVGNIKQVDKKVTWGDNCTQCLACFHWCPQAAIEIGKKSGNIARYHHPAIKVNDLIK